MINREMIDQEDVRSHSAPRPRHEINREDERSHPAPRPRHKINREDERSHPAARPRHTINREDERLHYDHLPSIPRPVASSRLPSVEYAAYLRGLAFVMFD